MLAPTHVGFGKQADLTPEQLVLTQPKYVCWLFDQERLSGQAAVLAKYIETTLLPFFDAKPFQRDCRYCKRSALYATGYENNSEGLYWWCDECDPW
jgi:hypothetical protein